MDPLRARPQSGDNMRDASHLKEEDQDELYIFSIDTENRIQQTLKLFNLIKYHPENIISKKSRKDVLKMEQQHN